MHMINEDINIVKMKVIHHENGFIGIMNKNDALLLARKENLDLILTNEKVEPPLCTIHDYGKFRFNLKKNTKKQKGPVTKEIKFRPNTDDHDLQIKAKQTQKFLSDGNIVKIKIVMYGREQSRSNIAHETFNKFMAMLNNFTVDIEKSSTHNAITIQIKGV